MKYKPKIAIVRGKFLNRYEMQFFEPLVRNFDITAFGSFTSYHDDFFFPVVKLPSPVDLPDFPFKMSLLNRMFIDAHYLWGLEEKLKGFDLVHTAETYFRYTQQCLNAKKKGYVRKVISTVLENIPFNNEGIWGRKEFKKRARVELDHIIALTGKTREALLAEGAEPEKITVISHFIDCSRFSPRKKAAGEKNITVLFVGRLEKYKGVYDVIEAARRLISAQDLQSYSLRFVLAGDGSERKNLQLLEKKLGLEKFILHKQTSYDEMPEIYRSADIFIAPSLPTTTWEEQYNTSLLEAQASGLPIVTTETGGIPENVGEAAIVVEPGNAGKLTEALRKFIFSPKLRAAFGQKARKRAETVHDIKTGAGKLSALYQKILASQGLVLRS